MEHTPARSVILVTVSGKDAPGITSELTGILAGEAGVRILDIAQAVIHGLLSLSLMFETERNAEDSRTLVKELLFKATELGLKLDYRFIEASSLSDSAVGTGGPSNAQSYRYAITLIADPVTAGALHDVTAVLARHRVNIDVIERLSEGEFGCVEMLVSAGNGLDRAALKRDLLAVARKLEVDIALQAEGLYRRTKRMVVFDMDSTLIQAEVIDEFARERGVYDEVARITEEAMRGGLDFDESLRRRVEKLRGLTDAQVEAVAARIRLTPGAEELVRALRKLGYTTAIISGGFLVVAERFRSQLGIDFAFANTLEMEAGVATGRVVAPIVNAGRKADILAELARKEGIPLDQVIAIGDGANDLPMLEKAGLGIAFNAKPVVREKAQQAINRKSLRSVLYLLGISGRDLNEIL